MAASNSIFLYITGGRTLWVPGHTPAPGENKPVHILNFASPRELSRSFYLFDMPIQLIDDPRAAALIPGGKTPEDVITAVNEFRRVCTEDQKFLLKRCYDANRPPPPVQNQSQPTPQTLQQPQQLLPDGLGTVDAFGMHQNPAFNTTGATNPGQALLLQLLQQQQQQRVTVPSQSSPLQQPPPMTFNRGGMDSTGNAAATGANMMMTNGGMLPFAHLMGYNSNYFNPMMPMGRSTGLMPAPNPLYQNSPGVRVASSPMMGARGPGRNVMPHSPFHAPVRSQPESLPPLPPIPPEILEVYMNPQQKLMCATMPGPRCTVWLREHSLPSDTKNPRYVFCKGGIVLMLKTKGSEVANSKPVELFEQQVCAHFLIHNYCSRSNCLHRHHTETQLRQLIAGKHVELKSMTKKERHRLSERVLEKEREGLARAAEDREQRAKERLEAAKRRQAVGAGSGADGADNNEVVTANADMHRKQFGRLDINSSEDGEDGGDKRKADDKSGVTCGDNNNNSNNDPQKGDGDKHGESSMERMDKEGGVVRTSSAGTSSITRRVAQASTRRVLNPADIGVTDSEGDDDDMSSFSSSSSSSPSASSSVRSDRVSVGATDAPNTTSGKKETKKKKKEMEPEDVVGNKNRKEHVVETTLIAAADSHAVAAKNNDAVVHKAHVDSNKEYMEASDAEDVVTQQQEGTETSAIENVEEENDNGKKMEKDGGGEAVENDSDSAEPCNRKGAKEKKTAAKRKRSPVRKSPATAGKKKKK